LANLFSHTLSIFYIKILMRFKCAHIFVTLFILEIKHLIFDHQQMSIYSFGK